MDTITVAGPDKVAIATFMDFLRHCLGNTHVPVMLHSLMSKESISQAIESILKNRKTVIFSYYAKRKINIDPLICVPEKLLDISDAVIWFDLYSTDFKILKDKVDFESNYRNRWKQNVERIDKLMGKG